MQWSITSRAKESPEATLAAGLVLAAQIPHAYYVFLLSGHALGFWTKTNAGLYAIGVETATFFFVLVGWSVVSGLFAGASVGINVAYYSLAHADLYGPGYMFDPSMLAITWPMWLLSVVLPVAVVAFSHATVGHGAKSTASSRSPVKWTNRLIDSVKSLRGRFYGPAEVETVVPAHVDLPVAPKVTRKTETSRDLDNKDEAILDYLSRHESGTKSDLANASGLSVGAVDRTKSGQRVGRLVKLEDAGLIVDNGDGTWSKADERLNLVRVETFEPVVFTNGHGA